MGQMKRMMEEIDDAQSEVEGIGVSAGWLQRCERHDEVFICDSDERGHAYALANWRVKHNTTFTSAEVLRGA
ncbi:hypothetical protein U8P73_36245 (plasmid) [Rhizobium beringeri]|uniref:hypothetical protein n=1 Tax=Rhizobium beringeri TaxID=3019934 RepID=UPI002DDD53BC|nr:hypothetical protein [Rhizobium beringeri]WSG93602.1 hypothetical protein U8P73_36245 [Rhizobium beringeri]